LRGFAKALLILLAIAIFLLGLYVLQLHLDARKVSEGFAESDIFEAMSPESFATTVLLAGFRGVLADMLWLRALKMEQDQKDFYQLQAIYELITRLQPGFEQVWHYAAWNLAYNIFFDVGSLDEKWEWLRAGTSILDEGIARNPRSYYLRWSLGQLYFYKYTQYPIFISRLRKETGRHPYDHALEWYLIAADHKRFPNRTVAQVRSVAQAHVKLAELALQEGRVEDEVSHLKSAIDQCYYVLEIVPDDAVAEKLIFQLSGRLAPAYARLAQKQASEGKGQESIDSLESVVALAQELWEKLPGDVERLLAAATSHTELAAAKASLYGLDAANADLDKAQSKLSLVVSSAAEAYKIESERPEFLYFQGKAMEFMARIAAIRGRRDDEIAFHQQQLEVFRALKEKLRSYGNTHKRNDYKPIERIIDEEIPRLQTKLETYKQSLSPQDLRGPAVR